MDMNSLDFRSLPSEVLAMMMTAVRKEDGNINWTTVFGGVVTAAIVGLSAATIDQGREISAMRARQEIVLQRLTALESGTSSATSERYRASDAARDFLAVRNEHAWIAKESQRAMDRMEARLHELEKRQK